MNSNLILRDKDNIRIILISQFYLLIYTFHNNLILYHIEIDKILYKLRLKYYWPDIIKDIDQYIHLCYKYQMKKLIKRVNKLHLIPSLYLFDK